MENEKNLNPVIIILILLIGIIIGIGATSIYNNLKDSSKDSTNKEQEPSTNTGEQKKDLALDERTYFDLAEGENFKNFEDLTLAEPILYNYLKQDKKDLQSYLNSLTNNEKLALGGVDEDVAFSTIEANLTKMFGATLGVEADSYYCYFNHTDEPVALYNYNEKTKKYEYNEEHDGHGAGPSNSLLNYKMKSIESEGSKKIVTFYGMYLNYHGFTIDAINEKNVTRNIVAELYDDNYTGIKNKEYFADLLKNHEEDFFQFRYTFEEKDGNYILVNFEKIA